MVECDCKVRGCPAANDVHCAYPVVMSAETLNNLTFLTAHFGRQSAVRITPEATLEMLVNGAAEAIMRSTRYGLPKENGQQA